QAKQIMLAMHNYHDIHKRFPAQAIYDKSGKLPLLSWRVLILPFVEENGLYKEFHLDEPWDSEHNKKLIEKMPAIFNSPGADLPPGKTCYVVPRGKNTLFEGDKGMRDRDIVDGTSKTIMLVEVGADKAVTWTKPDDMEV